MDFRQYKILIRKRKKANFGWGKESRLIKKFNSILSIDEAGRGSLAGPLSIGGLFLDKDALNFVKKQKIEFWDSKKSKEAERDFIHKIIQKIGLLYKVILISHSTIEKIGISGAFLIGMIKLIRCFKPKCVILDGRPPLVSSEQVFFGNQRFSHSPTQGWSASGRSGASPPLTSVVFAENLFFGPSQNDLREVPSKNLFATKTQHPDYTKPIVLYSFIKGDERLNSLGCASIVAKVKRDKHLIKLSKKYPQYKFAKHKGYGTKEHIKLIKKYGLSKIHRKYFCKNFIKFLLILLWIF